MNAGRGLSRLRKLLRPWPGRRLPRELRATRVGQIAETLAEGVAGPGFAALLERIDTGRVHRGNRATPYFTGDEAFAAMCAAIAGAREEVLLEAYILRDDATGHDLAERLIAAADRGATVRVLADAVGSLDTDSDFWAWLVRHGIEVRLFHPLFPTAWNPFVRDHRKILVVDRNVAFTGGMNVGDEYGGRGSGPAPFRSPLRGPWRDTHVGVEGPAAAEMAVVFFEGWTRAGGRAPELASSPEGEAGAGVLVLDSQPRRGHLEAAAVLAALVGAARRRLWIANAYFAPGHRAVELLGRAAARGVDVRLLLPGPTDVPLVRHAGHGYFTDLLTRGIRVFEYRPAVLHAKTAVADGHASVVGSTNLDFRSFQWNAECNLVILDDATGAALEAAFEADLAQAEEILCPAWHARPLLHRLGDRAARWLSPVL